MMLPLCLGIDPAKTAGVALVEPLGAGARPRLLLARCVDAELESKRGPDAWATRAYEHFQAVATLAAGRDVRCRYELTIGSKSGALGQARLHMRRGLLLGLAADAGAVRLAHAEHVMVQTWTSILGVPGAKEGDGWHRVVEAERLVDCPEGAFRGLGAGAVDAAEATLIACALARVLTGEWTPKAQPARKPRAAKRGKAA